MTIEANILLVVLRLFVCVRRKLSMARISARRRPLRLRKLKFLDEVIVFCGPDLPPRDLDVVRCADVASVFFKAAPEPPYTRSPPQIFGAPPGLEQQVAEHFNEPPVYPPPGDIAVFKGAIVIASGVVLSDDGSLVLETLINTELWTHFGWLVRDTVADPLRLQIDAVTVLRRLSSGPHILLKQTYDSNYGHWLVECLPRVAIAGEHFDLAACRFIVSDGHGAMQPIYFESLAVFGIKPEQIDVVGYDPVEVDTLVYPLPITKHPWVKSRRVLEFLATIPDRVGRTPGGLRRLYVSRNRGNVRRLVNEEDILAVCKGYGFELVHPETMSFVDQVRLFASAELVVGSYGANLSNIVFSRPQTQLFALTTEFMGDNFFWDLMDRKGGRYIALHGKAIGPTPDLNSDFLIDVKTFSNLLDHCVRTIDV